MEKESTLSDQDYHNYFKIRKTVIKMLEDRGYYIPDREKEMKFEDWKSNQKNKQLICFLAAKIENKEDYVYVESTDCLKLGVTEVTDFAKKLHSEGVRNGIIIIKGSITALAKQVIFYFK
jgi:DNA-directed RNA polymerase I, II, and III subunit RPABC1